MRERGLSAVDLELWKQRFTAVALEMGATLRRTGYSANIKERRDYSTAIFDAGGAMVAQGDDIPVHLGSMPLSVAAALQHAAPGPDDAVLLNDPFLGGTHLPDLTLVTPVCAPGERRPRFYVANRAHHADVGGMSPGSMPLAQEIFQEGIRIPPVRLIREGRFDPEILRWLLANVRTPEERRGDLRAQVAANHVGRRRLLELARIHGWSRMARAAEALQRYAERMMRALLRELPEGRAGAVDHLDDDGFGDGPVRLEVCVEIRRDRAVVDFTGSAPQAHGGVNAIEAITRSAVVYVFRCLLAEGIPSNDGCMRPIRLVLPRGSVVAAAPPAAVAAGNVETSQRLVDVLLAALQPLLPERIPAASCGSMNNLSIGGLDAAGRAYTYYETLGGGAGASPYGPGASGIHTHMTNSRNTPVEVLHARYPFRVTRYAVRRASGGAGRHRGGDGVVREYAFSLPAQVTVLSERRRMAPPGAAGGAPGAPGRNRWWRAGRWRTLPGKFTLQVEPGDRLRLETPGGGGWGRPRGRLAGRRPRV